MIFMHPFRVRFFSVLTSHDPRVPMEETAALLSRRTPSYYNT